MLINVGNKTIISQGNFEFQAREELLEKESTSSVKDPAIEKMVSDVLDDDETKSDELDMKSSGDEAKIGVRNI